LKALFKGAGSLLLLFVCLGFLYLNLALYSYPTPKKSDSQVIDQDLLYQLNFLNHALHNGAGHDMQQLYPEGFVFIHAFYGLSWCDVAEKSSLADPLYQRALAEIAWASDQIQSDEGKHPFDPNLTPAYGAFYAGWSNYLLGRKLALLPPASRDSNDVVTFKAQCQEIAKAIGHSQPFPPSYPQAAWPADGVLCVTSLVLHDCIWDSRYEETLRIWVQQVKRRLDPATGLIPHAVVPHSGKPLGGARGSSQSLMLSLLPDIDPAFAQQQFLRYQALFQDTLLGFTGIREYPKGQNGEADIDSGPVILGMGGAATIVGVRTLHRYGQHASAWQMRQEIEAFGLPWQSAHGKMYAFGKLPIADAFIAWSGLINMNENAATSAPGSWRLPFHLLSLLIVLPSIRVLFWAWRK
jgi:hypothetical protein